jgi:hypothetical protein
MALGITPRAVGVHARPAAPRAVDHPVGMDKGSRTPPRRPSHRLRCLARPHAESAPASAAPAVPSAAPTSAVHRQGSVRRPGREAGHRRTPLPRERAGGRLGA